VYPFPEKGEAGASIDSVGSLRVDVVTELKEPGNGVMVSFMVTAVKTSNLKPNLSFVSKMKVYCCDNTKLDTGSLRS
jgi:hypothetical protein